MKNNPSDKINQIINSNTNLDNVAGNIIKLGDIKSFDEQKPKEEKKSTSFFVTPSCKKRIKQIGYNAEQKLKIEKVTKGDILETGVRILELITDKVVAKGSAFDSYEEFENYLFYLINHELNLPD